MTETLVYKSDRVRPELKRWVDDVRKWDFTYVSPAHFAAGQGVALRVEEGGRAPCWRVSGTPLIHRAI